jgi:hypothetical protein
MIINYNRTVFMIVNYNRTVIKTVNYDPKTFIVQATGVFYTRSHSYSNLIIWGRDTNPSQAFL